MHLAYQRQGFVFFRKAISATVDTAIEVTKAVVILHTFLMTDWHNNLYCPSNFVDHERNGVFQPGEWREELGNNAFERMQNMGSNNYSRLAKVGRDRFKEYFTSQEGSVPWQYAMITSTNNSFDFM